MADSTASSSSSAGREVYLFFALACAITWLLDLPWVLACVRGETPPPWAMMLTALGAFGPTLAAVAIAAPRRELRGVFGRWRTGLVWIFVALALPYPLHLLPNLIEVALGGRPAQWFYPPVLPEHVAALVFFSVGEEFGWRGFAFSRMAARHGVIVGNLLLGAVWGLWHLGMMFTPGRIPSVWTVLIVMATMAVASVVWAWVFERGNRSMAVALALHAGAHLDNENRAPESEVRLRVLRFAVLVAAALLAGWALTRRRSAGATGAPQPAATSAAPSSPAAP